MGHVMVDEDHLVVVVAVADQRYQMKMAELGEHLDLCLEFLGPLL